MQAALAAEAARPTRLPVRATSPDRAFNVPAEAVSSVPADLVEAAEAAEAAGAVEAAEAAGVEEAARAVEAAEAPGAVETAGVEEAAALVEGVGKGASHPRTRRSLFRWNYEHSM